MHFSLQNPYGFKTANSFYGHHMVTLSALHGHSAIRYTTPMQNFSEVSQTSLVLVRVLDGCKKCHTQASFGTSITWKENCWTLHTYGLVQERRNSSTLAMELRLSCTKPSIQSPTHTLYDARAGIGRFRVGSCNFTTRKVVQFYPAIWCP